MKRLHAWWWSWFSALKKNTHAHPWLLNVNVPDVAFDELQGTLVTRLGNATRLSRW